MMSLEGAERQNNNCKSSSIFRKYSQVVVFATEEGCETHLFEKYFILRQSGEMEISILRTSYSGVKTILIS